MFNPFERFMVFDEDGGGNSAADDFNLDIDAMLGRVEEGVIDPKAVEIDNSDKLPITSDVGDNSTDGDDDTKEVKGTEKKEGDKKDPEKEPTDLEAAEARGKVLEGIIEKMATGEPVLDAPETPKDEVKEGEKKEFMTVPVVDMTPITFLEKQDSDSFRGVMDDPEAFAKQQNEFGNAILNKGLERAISKIIPALSKLIPDYFDLRMETERFYAKNPELNKIRGYVGKVLNEVRQNNPGMQLGKQLDKTKVEVYKLLKLPSKQTTTNGNMKGRNPKFAGPGSQARPTAADEKSEMQEGMDSMMKVVT